MYPLARISSMTRYTNFYFVPVVHALLTDGRTPCNCTGKMGGRRCSSG
jgi:hypothetical protein